MISRIRQHADSERFATLAGIGLMAIVVLRLLGIG